MGQQYIHKGIFDLPQFGKRAACTSQEMIRIAPAAMWWRYDEPWISPWFDNNTRQRTCHDNSFAIFKGVFVIFIVAV